MDEYFVSYMCVYSDTVEAECPEDAARIVANNCEYDIDGPAYVINIDTSEEFEI